MASFSGQLPAICRRGLWMLRIGRQIHVGRPTARSPGSQRIEACCRLELLDSSWRPDGAWPAGEGECAAATAANIPLAEPDNSRCQAAFFCLSPTRRIVCCELRPGEPQSKLAGWTQLVRSSAAWKSAGHNYSHKPITLSDSLIPIPLWVSASHTTNAPCKKISSSRRITSQAPHSSSLSASSMIGRMSNSPVAKSSNKDSRLTWSSKRSSWLRMPSISRAECPSRRSH